MIYKRYCVLTFRQLAHTSTGPDTLFDASERPRANTAHNIQQIAFNVYCSFLATVHACIVRSFAARSRRYAARMQRCACEQEQARLAISERKRSDAPASAASPASAAAATPGPASTALERKKPRHCRARPAFSREDARRHCSSTSTQQESSRRSNAAPLLTARSDRRLHATLQAASPALETVPRARARSRRSGVVVPPRPPQPRRTLASTPLTAGK